MSYQNNPDHVAKNSTHRSNEGSGEPQTRTDAPAQRGGINDTPVAYSDRVTDRNDAVGSDNPPQLQRQPLPPAPNLGQPPNIDVGNTGIPVELLQIIGQLKQINEWFYLYRDVALEGCVPSSLFEIESALGKTAICISELAAFELLEAYFYEVKVD